MQTVAAMPEKAAAASAGRSGALDLLASAGIAGAWAAWFAAAGTIGSGFHLADDHEIVSLAAELRARPFLAVLRDWVLADIQARFRPLYVVHRAAEVAVLGEDLRAWGLYTAGLLALTSVVLYLAVRRLGFPVAAALAFAFFSLCGSQAAIGWRLGPNETIGMPLLALGLWGLAAWSRGGAPWGRAVFWAGAVGASLCKESFVALLPALAAAAPWSLVAQRARTWRDAARTCVPDLLVLGGALGVEALIIVLGVGTERTGYAGLGGVTVGRAGAAAARLLDAEEARALAQLLTLGWVAAWLSAPDRARGAMRVALMSVVAAALANSAAGDRALLPSPPQAVALALLFAAGWALAWARGERRWRWRWPWRAAQAVPAAALAALVIGGQAIVYAKPGIWERYLLPGSLATAFLLAGLVRGVCAQARAVDSGGGGTPGRAGGSRGALRAAAALAACACLLLPLGRRRAAAMSADAREFAAEGRATQAFLDRLAAVPADREVIVAGGLGGVEEHFLSIRRYLAARCGRERVRFLFLPPAALTPLEQEWVRRFERDPAAAKLATAPAGGPPGAVAILPWEEAEFPRRAPWFDPAAYERWAARGFVVYTLR